MTQVMIELENQGTFQAHFPKGKLFPLSNIENNFPSPGRSPRAARDWGSGQILMAEDLSFMGQPNV